MLGGYDFVLPLIFILNLFTNHSTPKSKKTMEELQINKISAVLNFIDFRKAFDLIRREKLFLHDSKQIIIVKNHKSATFQQS